MSRLFLYLTGLFALAASFTAAKADTFFTWNVSGNYTEVCSGGSPCTNGAISTFSASLYLDTTTGTLGSPPPNSSFTFVGVNGGGSSPPTLSFTSLPGFGTANSCTPGGTCTGGYLTEGFFATAPAGTTFELKLCATGCTTSNVGYIIIDVDTAAYNGATSLIGFDGGTIVGGAEYGGECSTSPPSSGATCATLIGSTATSTTPLPGALPLLATGLVGLWGCFRRRRGSGQTLEESFDRSAIASAV